MFWLYGFLMLVLVLLTWLLFSALELKIDTREVRAELRWKTIGWVRVWHEEQWLIRFGILFFSKTMPIEQLNRKKKKPPKKVETGAPTKSPSRLKNIPRRLINVMRSFQVLECTLAIDTGDNITNAHILPLSYAPILNGHLFINFVDENYLVLKIRNRPWKILYAFLRRPFSIK